MIPEKEIKNEKAEEPKEYNHPNFDKKESEWIRNKDREERAYIEQQRNKTRTAEEDKTQQNDLCETCSKFYRCSIAKSIEKLDKIQTQCSEYQDISELPKKSLDDVYKVFTTWFPRLNTTRIDTRLAWKISNEFGVGDSLWLFEVSRSGLAKSTLSASLSESPKVIPVGQLSPKALISGKTVKVGKIEKPASDLGMRLHRRNRCIIVGEAAYLKAMNQGEKKELFSCLKQLYDGELIRDTGNDVSKHYYDCNTSIWFNSTPDFHKELIIHQEIGTCYLVDSIDLKLEDDDAGIEKAIKDRKKTAQMKKETTEIVKGYLAHHHLKDIEFEEDDIQFIKRESNRLKWIRTVGSYDRYNELEYLPQPEFPARIAKQISKLYQCLLSLDENYDKERARKIVERIVDGSGDSVMVKVLESINSYYWTLKQAGRADHKFTVTNIVTMTGLGTQTVKKRLELLRGLKFLARTEKDPGEKGGRPGYEYFLKDDVDEEAWQELFRHEIYRKKDIDDNDEHIGMPLSFD